jgi:hypothetical protein
MRIMIVIYFLLDASQTQPLGETRHLNSDTASLVGNYQNFCLFRRARQVAGIINDFSNTCQIKNSLESRQVLYTALNSSL